MLRIDKQTSRKYFLLSFLRAKYKKHKNTKFDYFKKDFFNTFRKTSK